jgi:hypothetical protein
VEHLDPDRLILLALGEEDTTTAEAGHLDRCPVCRAELDSTRTVVSVARDGASLRDLPAPAPAVWDRIAAEALGPAAATPPGPVALAPLPPVVRPARPSRRMPRRAVLALAAAACLVLGAFGATGLQALLRRGDGVRVLAQAELTAQPGAPSGAHGTARVIDTGHGRQLEIAIDGVPVPPGYYTVWIYDGRDVMIPLGSPGAEPLNIPAAADDLDVFHVVDVSAQELGQQQHGRSVLQGSLRGGTPP